jgi:hypothetical protein
MYKIKTDEHGGKIILLEKGDKLISFGENPSNTDYQEYLKWLEEGNTPEEAENMTTVNAAIDG